MNKYHIEIEYSTGRKDTIAAHNVTADEAIEEAWHNLALDGPRRTMTKMVITKVSRKEKDDAGI